MQEYRGRPAGAGRRFAIVVSRFNDVITDRLLAGARACLLDHGVAAAAVDVAFVPGAWEIPYALQLMLQHQPYDAAIAIGCIIRGDTPHFDFVASGATHGVSEVALRTGVPIALGLLTTDDVPQAMARAGGRGGNKGWESALAALEMADLRNTMKSTS